MNAAGTVPAADGVSTTVDCTDGSSRRVTRSFDEDARVQVRALRDTAGYARLRRLRKRIEHVFARRRERPFIRNFIRPLAVLLDERRPDYDAPPIKDEVWGMKQRRRIYYWSTQRSEIASGFALKNHRSIWRQWLAAPGFRKVRILINDAE